MRLETEDRSEQQTLPMDAIIRRVHGWATKRTLRGHSQAVALYASIAAFLALLAYLALSTLFGSQRSTAMETRTGPIIAYDKVGTRYEILWLQQTRQREDLK